MGFSNILIAENDIDDLSMFSEALAEVCHDYKLARALNGLECLRLVKENSGLDIIFLDLNMPMRNGMECLKWIRTQEGARKIPIVIYSSSHMIKDIDSAYKHGATLYLVKPSAYTMLVRLLKKVFFSLEQSETIEFAKESFVIRDENKAR